MNNVLLPMDTRRQLLRVLKTRYQVASKAEKTWILEEFILISGYHRKSAIRWLNGAVTSGSPQRGLSPARLWYGRSSCSAGSDCPLGSFRQRLRALLPQVHTGAGETRAPQSESGTPRTTSESQCIVHRSPIERSTYHRR